MNVAFDIDGVLTDLEKFQIEYGRKYFGREEKNKKGSSIRELFACSEVEEYNFWKKYLLLYAMNWPVREGAREIINKIAEEGNKIYFITSRIKAHEKSIVGAIIRSLVKKFLRGISYEEIIFCSVSNSAEEKYNACLKHEIDIMIEDSPANIDKIREITDILCFDASYNREIDCGIDRVRTFNEIYLSVNRRNPNAIFHFLDMKERRNLNANELQTHYCEMQKYFYQATDVVSMHKREKKYMRWFPTLHFLFRLKYPYRVMNKERVPVKNGVIYVANHRDLLDPPLVMAVIGKKPVHLLLKAEYKKRSYGFWLTSIGCIYVQRDNRDSQILAKEEMIKTILSGGNVIIFPEGTRNRASEELLPFQLGAVSVAKSTGASIVPIGIYKDNDKRVVLNVGNPMNVGYEAELTEACETLREKVKVLIEEAKKA